MFDYTVFIGRFQPFHNGHLNILREALTRSKRLILLVGSANRARDIRNPWTYQERCDMINSCLTLAEKSRIFYAPLPDYLYQDGAWVENVQKIVYNVIEQSKENHSPTVALIGHSKDNTSYYLNLFPQWRSIEIDDVTGLNSTDIRNNLFDLQKGNPWEIEKFMPKSVQAWLDNWRAIKGRADFLNLADEYNFVKNYKEQWKTKKDGGQVPYPVIFQTTDAVVEQSGHILMIVRGDSPGKGQLALPGGFLEYDLTLQENMLKELREETQLKVPEPVLIGSIVNQHTFDAVHRSTRGRTITHSYHIKLQDRPELPKVKGGSDAKKAIWMPFAKLDPKNIFEDHWFQIQYFKK
jgi:bifunctional NMN adenylyltransferase/nudix hydrolase